MDRREFVNYLSSVMTGSILIDGKGIAENPVNKIFTCQLMSVGSPNHNNRIYSKEIINREINRLKSDIDNNKFIGTLGVPESSIINISQASHMIKDLKIENDNLFAKIEILNTPSGTILLNLMKEHPNDVVFRTSGTGSAQTRDDGVGEIGEDYTLNCVFAYLERK